MAATRRGGGGTHSSARGPGALTEGADHQSPVAPRFASGDLLLEGDEQGGLEDGVGAPDAQSWVGAHQVLEQGVIGLKPFRVVEVAAEGRSALHEPGGAGAPGVDLDYAMPQHSQALARETVRRAGCAPHAVRQDAQTGVAEAHAAVGHGAYEVDRPPDLQREAGVGRGRRGHSGLSVPGALCGFAR